MPQTDKFFQKQQQLANRTSIALSISSEEACALLMIGRNQSVRINTLKVTKDSALAAMQQLGVYVEDAPFITDGLFIENGVETLRDSNLAEEGNIYIQNAASWLPVLALDPKSHETILDMCAAPGGKTSHIAQLASNQARITANDNSRPRLHKLQRNLERLGVQNVTYTLHDATRLARQFELASFDKILLDAPCSGEGMMTLDNKKDFESWSVAHIKRLQQLQKKLIVQAWELLKPGGTLVYSTCTMSPEENEAVIDYLLRHNENVQIDDLEYLACHLDNKVRPVMTWNDKTYDTRISKALRLKPSPRVEAFFVIKLTKTTTTL